MNLSFSLGINKRRKLPPLLPPIRCYEGQKRFRPGTEGSNCDFDCDAAPGGVLCGTNSPDVRGASDFAGRPTLLGGRPQAVKELFLFFFRKIIFVTNFFVR